MILHTLLRSRSRLAFLACLFAVGLLAGNAQAQPLIGRITDVEGQLYLYVKAQNDWVPTVKDAPFGLSDSVYTNPDSKAEIVMPNNVVLRLGPSSQVQLVAAKPALAEFAATAGVARFSSQNSTAAVNVTTPYGVIEAKPGAAFDVYLGGQSLEVLALAGSVAFIHAKDNTPYAIMPGGTSLLANATEVGPGSGAVDPAWGAWNQALDKAWAQRAAAAAASVQYLPKPLRRDAYELDRNGRWERVLYRGKEVMMWRPNVSRDWAPFSAGRWVEWNGDTTWVPAESFGYVTHHYGNWVNVNGAWYWQPPRPTGPEPSWYPGRVAWVGSGEEVGWVPLAPEEPYYAHRQWGPEAVVVAGAAAVVTAIAIAALTNANHAIVVPQRDFHGVDSYVRYRDRRVNRDMLEHRFRPAPVINNTVVNNYTTNVHRYSFTSSKALAPKPVAPMPPRTPALAQKPGGAQPGAIPQPSGKPVPPKPIPQAPTRVVPVSAGVKPSGLTSPRPTPGGAPATGAMPQAGIPPKPGLAAPGKPGLPAPVQPGKPGGAPQPSGLTSPRPTPGGAPATGAMPQGGIPPKPGLAAPGKPGLPVPVQPGKPGGTPQPSGLTSPRPTPGGAPATGAMPQAGIPPKPGLAAPGKPVPPVLGPGAAGQPSRPAVQQPPQTPSRSTNPSGPGQMGAPTGHMNTPGMQRPQPAMQAPQQVPQPNQEQLRRQQQLQQQQMEQRRAQDQARQQQQQMEQQRRMQEQTRQQQMQQQQMEQRRAQEQARQQQQQLEQQRHMQEQARQQQMQRQQMDQRRAQEQARQPQPHPQQGQKGDAAYRNCQQNPNDPRCK